MKPEAVRYNNQAWKLQCQNQYSEAIKLYQRAWDIDHIQNIIANMGNCYSAIGKIKESIECFEKANKITFNPAYYSNLLRNLNFIEDRGLRIEHEKWQKLFAPMMFKFNNKNRIINNKIRIGYLSSGFKRHPISYFMEPILDHHDKNIFDVYLFSEVKELDRVSQRIFSKNKVFDISRAQTEESAQLIYDQKIDILVDLNGHNDYHNPLIFTLKPAPIQITYLGYPNTTGISTMDYRITDEISDPKENDEYYTEKLIRIPEGFLCYRPSFNCPPIKQIKKPLSFGCMNNISKITNEMLKAWAEILIQVPDSTIILKSKVFEENESKIRIRDHFIESGVEANRVLLLERMESYESHMNIYNEIDIVLDTYPYNGTTTTLDALWMGCPVITLQGKVHASRVSSSILTQLKMGHLIAHSYKEYIQLGIRMAESGVFKDERFRDYMKVSSLMDEKGFTQKLEKAYLSILSTKSRAGAIEGGLLHQTSL